MLIRNKWHREYYNLIVLVVVLFVVVLGLIVNYLTFPQVQLQPVEEFRIFVTNETFNGGFGSIFGADSICTNLANQSGLAGNNWRTWLSNEYVSVSERLYHSNVPYVIYDEVGTKSIIANNWDDLLDGSINAPIEFDQFGKSIGSVRVWTGTKAGGGLSLADCNNWQIARKVSFDEDDIYFGMSGGNAATDEKWTENSDTDTCGFRRHIYCIQQPDTQQRIRVFVTSDRYDPFAFVNYKDKNNDVWTGLAAMDAICNDYAFNANLNRPDTIGWKAWASDTQTAMKDRYPHYELPFVRLADDVQIADGWADLTDGSLDAAIARDQRGDYEKSRAWTHTAFDGSIDTKGNFDACADWTSNSGESRARGGYVDLTDSSWTSSDNQPCYNKEKIYCFEMIETNG